MGVYRTIAMKKSRLSSVPTVEGERLEQKIERIISNKEPIKDGAPEIFTERKEGVIAAYNIRTDRWEVATEAMDLVSKNITAKREERAKAREEAKVIKMPSEGGNTETAGQSTHGEKGAE